MRWTLLTALFAAAGLSLGFSAPAQAALNTDQVNNGAEIVAPGDCVPEKSDLVLALCSIIPGANCPSKTRTCQTYERAITTGTSLGSPSPQAKSAWNGRGGSGQFTAEATVCALRDLHKFPNGRIESAITVGGFQAVQQVGFKSFDPKTATFEGYRRIIFKMPMLGSTEAVRQDFTVSRRNFSIPPFMAALIGAGAGDRPISAGHGLAFWVKEDSHKLGIALASIDIATPIGPVSVIPFGVYETAASIIRMPSKKGAFNWQGFLSDSEPTPIDDLFGVTGSAAWTTAPAPVAVNSPNGGWLSSLGLGTRGMSLDTKVWNGQGLRPDFDMSSARNEAEKKASVFAAAGVTARYPKNLAEVLPPWVFSLPFIMPPEFFVEVTPAVGAMAGGQLMIGAGEGQVVLPQGEFGFKPGKLSTAAIGSQLGGSAAVTVSVRFFLRLRIDPPIWDPKTIVHIDKIYTLQIFPGKGTPPARGQAHGYASAAMRIGGPGQPVDTNDTITLLNGQSLKGAAAKAFIDDCLTTPPPPPQTPTPVQPTPTNDAKDLFAVVDLWPCNVCIASPEHDNSEGKTPAQSGFIMLSVQAPTFKCNNFAYAGCHEMCEYAKSGNKLNRVKTLKQLFAEMQPNDTARPMFQRCVAGAGL